MTRISLVKKLRENEGKQIKKTKKPASRKSRDAFFRELDAALLGTQDAMRRQSLEKLEKARQKEAEENKND